MSDENDGVVTPDPITNIKAEMGRKLDNQAAELAALKEQISKFQQNPAPAPKQETQEEFDPFEPAKVERYIQKQVTGALSSFEQRQAEANRKALERQNEMVKLVTDFPELNSPSSEFYQEAASILSQMPKEYQDSPLAYRAAVTQAAVNKGIKPSSQRKKGDDEGHFQLGNGSGSSGGKKKKSEDDMDPATIDFLRFAGVNVDDEKVQEKIKKVASRKNYGRYE